MGINFHDLYQKYAQDVYRFAYWLCGDAQDAEDITSETFVRALTSTHEIQTETVKGYLLTIARNLAFKKAKRANRLADLTPGLPALGNGPEKTAETNLSLRGVMQFMQTLPEIDRAALLLHIQDDLSYEEISKVLGTSLAAAKVKVHRTRLKLNAYRMREEESRT